LGYHLVLVWNGTAWDLGVLLAGNGGLKAESEPEVGIQGDLLGNETAKHGAELNHQVPARDGTNGKETEVLKRVTYLQTRRNSNNAGGVNCIRTSLEITKKGSNVNWVNLVTGEMRQSANFRGVQIHARLGPP